MDFLPDAIEDYAAAFTSPQRDLLARIERYTYTSVLRPRMLSGHLQGRLLALIAGLKQPKRILEVGTYTGYSAICLLEGLPTDGELHTIEIDDEREPHLREVFAESGRAAQVHLHIGDAEILIPALSGTFDLVFLDADKRKYPLYFDLLADRITPGGLLIADNVLWSGKVLDEAEQDPETVALRELARNVHQDQRFENLLLPLRDGLLIAQRR